MADYVTGSLGARQDIEPHLFASVISNDESLRENILAFAQRNGFSLTFGTGGLSFGPDEPAEELDTLLAAASDRDIDVLLNINGPFDDIADDVDMVTDNAAMRETLDHIRAAAETYAKYYPEGRVYVWHEAPIHGNWRQYESFEKTVRRRDMIERVLEHGSRMFPAEQAAIKDVSSDLDVGLFLHHPLLPSTEHTKTPVFTRLMERLGEVNALPDFAYVDIYRGYYEWETGYAGINKYIEDIVTNVRDSLQYRPIHILLQAHTINNNYTPSKQAIVGNLQSAIDGGADGVGWYFRGSYRETHPRNYAPFVPNTGGVNEMQFTSFTGSRDRQLYASLLLREQRPAFDPASKFDLVLYGHDFDFYAHRLSLQDSDGAWEFVGDFSGYADGDTPYAGGGRDRAVAFHALDRDRFFDDELELLIETAGDADGATLSGAYVLPYGGSPRYRTEPELTSLIEGNSGIMAAALGSTDDDTDLSPGDRQSIRVSLGDSPIQSLTTIGLDSRQRNELREIARSESQDRTSYRNSFDLWVYGRKLDEAEIEIGGEPIGYTAFESEDGSSVLVARRLDKDAHFAEHRVGKFLDLSLSPSDSADVHAVFAVPNHGAANFKTADEILTILRDEYGSGHGQIGRFCLGSATWPGRTGHRDTYTQFLHIDDRTVVESDPMPDDHPIYSSTSW